MNLLDSAEKFLVASLDSFSDGELTFSILHAMIAVELLLKERLNRIDNELIFKKDKLGKVRKDRTVGMSEIPGLLEKSGIVLNDNENLLIRTVGEWRNAIVHHVPSYDSQVARAHLYELYNFILGFVRAQLGMDVKDYLGRKNYSRLENDIAELKKISDAARQKAHDSGRSDEKYPCSECCVVGVVEITGEENAYCHYCDKDLYTAICVKCENPVHGYRAVGSINDTYCNDCTATEVDSYINQQIDLMRGK